MTMIKTFKKTQVHIHAVRWEADNLESARLSAMEICKWVGSGSAYIPPTKDDPRSYLQIPTMFGPRDAKVGDYVAKIEENTFLVYKPAAFESEYQAVTDEEHRLIQHARHELSMFPNEDPEFIESIINAVKSFTEYRGHSGSSAEIAVQMLSALLNGRNLLPLTNDPDEWEFKPGADYDIETDLWQNKRNSAALSEDGGKTFFLVNEKQPGELVGDKQQVRIYTSVDKNFEPVIDPEDLKSDDEKEEVNES